MYLKTLPCIHLIFTLLYVCYALHKFLKNKHTQKKRESSEISEDFENEDVVLTERSEAKDLP